MKVMASLAALSLLVLCAHATPVYSADARAASDDDAPPAAMLPSETESPTPPISSPAQAPPAIRKTTVHIALPDTVLARILFARGSADVTHRQFMDAAAQLNLPPGPLTPELGSQVLDLLIQKQILTRRALRDPRSWAHVDSVSYNGLADRLTLSGR